MTNEAFVKILPKYIESSYISNAIAERIADGEALKDKKRASALLMEVTEMAELLACYCNRPPIDVAESFSVDGVAYDGQKCICNGGMDAARKTAQKLMYSPASLEEYEMGSVIYFCTTRNLVMQAPCVAAAS